METFLRSPIPIVLFFILFTIFSLPNLSKKGWAKVGRIISGLLFLTSLIWLVVTLYSGVGAKYDASEQKMHGREISKVTEYVEQLLNDGEYTKAKLILKKFNEDYPNKSWHPEELEAFVDSLLKVKEIPLNTKEGK